MAFAFTFPGQGSQNVGMGAELAQAVPAAREVFEEVDEALGQNLFRLMREGPAEDLTLTENAQPALMAMSAAVMRVLVKDAGLDLAQKAKFVAGHSLGEYSALVAAEALGLADAARLLKTRGQAMQKAVPPGEGAMAALLGIDIDAVAEKVISSEDAGICAIANDNAPGQVVISGEAAAVEGAIERAKAAGARKAMALAVSAPFHCALMAPAAEAMEVALEHVQIETPRVPLVANVTAEPVSDPGEIRRLLVEQVTGRVRWRESVAYMAGHGVENLVEVGAGKILTGMAKRIDRSLGLFNVETPADIDAFAKLI